MLLSKVDPIRTYAAILEEPMALDSDCALLPPNLIAISAALVVFLLVSTMLLSTQEVSMRLSKVPWL